MAGAATLSTRSARLTPMREAGSDGRCPDPTERSRVRTGDAAKQIRPGPALSTSSTPSRTGDRHPGTPAGHPQVARGIFMWRRDLPRPRPRWVRVRTRYHLNSCGRRETVLASATPVDCEGVFAAVRSKTRTRRWDGAAQNSAVMRREHAGRPRVPGSRAAVPLSSSDRKCHVRSDDDRAACRAEHVVPPDSSRGRLLNDVSWSAPAFP